MTPTNLGWVVAEAWDRALTLMGYGRKPLTVGWWRGQSFVYLWDFRTGAMRWRAWTTTRPETAGRRYPFSSDALVGTMR